MMLAKNVAMLVFDDVEPLDFHGPMEVFAAANQDALNQNAPPPFKVFLVMESSNLSRTHDGRTGAPQFDLDGCPEPGILLAPGGSGARRALSNPTLIAWLQRNAKQAALILGVGAGVLLLAEAGLLDGLEATADPETLDLLPEIAPRVAVQKDRRFVDAGNVITSASGTVLALNVVSRILGEESGGEAAARVGSPRSWPGP
ncbi:MAG: DJ-1/PfpI family protein [Planctomycetales bacterium]